MPKLDADVIIAVCAPTRACYLSAEVAMRTCAATTDANVVIAANNMPVLEFKSKLNALAVALGMRWVWYEPTPFNIARCFNEAIRSTSSKYYACCGQDVIFYQHWLDNLILAWEAEPEYFTLSPYSFNLFRNDFTCSLPSSPRSGIAEIWPWCTAAFVHRRDKLVLYDENIPTECDSDLCQYCRAHSLRTGIVLNSRVDHLGQVVQSELGGWNQIMGGHDQIGEDAKRLAQKWHL